MRITTKSPCDVPHTILIVGATYATGNMGVDALLSGTIASVWQADPKVRIQVLDYGLDPLTWAVPSGLGSREVGLFNLRFSWKIWLPNNGFRLLALALLARMLPSEFLRKQLIGRQPGLALVRDASTMLSLAGGDSFSDIYGIRRLIYVSLPQLLVLAIGRPLVLLPQTLGPFKAGWARWVGRFIMRRAHWVYSRDEAGLKVARELLHPHSANVSFSHDMAFALEPESPATVPDWAHKKDRPLVGLNVSGLLYMGGYTGGNMFGLRGDYPEIMRRLIRWFICEAGTDVVLVSHVSGDWEGDGRACAALYEEMKGECRGRLHLADPGNNHREIKYLIGKCDFFLGSRMHACIAALSQGIPAVGLAYSRKFAGVYQSVEVGDLVIDLRTEASTTVVDKVAELFERRERFNKTLVNSSAFARKQAHELVSRLMLQAGHGALENGLPVFRESPEKVVVS